MDYNYEQNLTRAEQFDQGSAQVKENMARSEIHRKTHKLDELPVEKLQKIDANLLKYLPAEIADYIAPGAVKLKGKIPKDNKFRSDLDEFEITRLTNMGEAGLEAVLDKINTIKGPEKKETEDVQEQKANNIKEELLLVNEAVKRWKKLNDPNVLSVKPKSLKNADLQELVRKGENFIKNFSPAATFVGKKRLNEIIDPNTKALKELEKIKKDQPDTYQVQRAELLENIEEELQKFIRDCDIKLRDKNLDKTERNEILSRKIDASSISNRFVGHA
jgi:hypothetical protein